MFLTLQCKFNLVNCKVYKELFGKKPSLQECDPNELFLCNFSQKSYSETFSVEGIAATLGKDTQKYILCQVAFANR